MVQTYQETFDLNGVSASFGDDIWVDLTSSIDGAILITDIYLSIENVDLENYNDSTRDTEFEATLYTYYNAVGGYQDDDYDTVNTTCMTEPSDNVTGNGTATQSGPFDGSGVVNNRNGFYATEGVTVGIKITTTNQDVDWNGTTDVEVELLGRKML